MRRLIFPREANDAKTKHRLSDHNPMIQIFVTNVRFIKWAGSGQNQQTELCAQRKLRASWAQSDLRAFAVRMRKIYHKAHSEDSDQAGRMLIWVFNGRTVHFDGFVVLI